MVNGSSTRQTARDIAHPTFRGLRLLLGDKSSPERLIAVMALVYTAYLDASGTHGGAKVVGFSGVLSTKRGWARFTRRFAKAIAAAPLLPDGFHMTRFTYFTRKADHDAKRLGLDRDRKDSRGWSINDRQAIGEELARSVLDIEPRLIFSCTIDRRDLATVLSQSEQRKLVTPEVMCLPWCFEAVRGWTAGKDRDERVEFVFDHENDPKKSSAILGAYQSYSQQFGDARFATHAMMRCRADMLPLVAADLVAHGICSSLELNADVKTGAVQNGLIQQILHGTRVQDVVSIHLDRARLEELRADIDKRRIYADWLD